MSEISNFCRGIGGLKNIKFNMNNSLDNYSVVTNLSRPNVACKGEGINDNVTKKNGIAIGKAILDLAKKQGVSLTVYNMAGILSAIYQESAFNSYAHSTTSTAAGIAQWIRERQLKIVDHFKGKAKADAEGNKDKCNSAFCKTVSFETQVKALIWELETNNSFKNLLSKIANCNDFLTDYDFDDAKKSAIIFTCDFEKPFNSYKEAKENDGHWSKNNLNIGYTIAKELEYPITVKKNSGVNLHPKAEAFLQKIPGYTGTITITSGQRSAEKQAEAMLYNIERHGIASQYSLYGGSGDRVIDVYKQNQKDDNVKQKMAKEIVRLGPENVSRHCYGSSSKIIAFDISKGSDNINTLSNILTGLKNKGVIKESKDEERFGIHCIHVEIPI